MATNSWLSIQSRCRKRGGGVSEEPALSVLRSEEEHVTGRWCIRMLALLKVLFTDLEEPDILDPAVM